MVTFNVKFNRDETVFSSIKNILKIGLHYIRENIFPHYYYGKMSYSQDGEEMVLEAFFEIEKLYHGFYVDIGAHHPYRFSNTAYFYKKGWSGINIEPEPSALKKFKLFRKRDINLNIGISSANSILLYHVFNEPALNSFDAEFSEFRQETTQDRILNKIEIQTYTLSEVLDKNMPFGKKIDFLSIDVEGFDFQVLRSNDWSKYIPTFILIEQDFCLQTILNDEIYIPD